MVNQVTDVKTEIEARNWLFSSKLDFEKSSEKMALIVSPEVDYPFDFEKVMSIAGNFQVKGTPLIITGKNGIYKDTRTYFICKSKSELESE